jgi:hypothetical protein
MMKFILVTLFAILSAVAAFPAGAPVCTIDESAPGAPHRGTGFRTGPLSDAAFIVTVGGKTLDTATTLEIEAGTVYDVIFTSETGSQPYKGVLGIIHSSTYNFTSTNLITGTADLQNSEPCAFAKGRAGVTHVNNNDKTSALAKLSIPANVDVVKLDVNIVVANNGVQGSIFYYTQYTLKVSGATNSPIAAPRISCGLFRLGIFCPFTFCGLFGRLLFGTKEC